LRVCRGLALAWWALKPALFVLAMFALVAAIAVGMARLFLAR
jgi:hypothetical protein